ncbi:transposon ty3-I gag-pol polyprotein [Tanacetum coccineum]
MKKLVKAKFLPENHRQEAFLDYHNLSQQNMTVEEVINEFDKLRMRCDVVKEEEQVVARFLGVLKPEIADIVSLQPYWTYTDVCRLALMVENILRQRVRVPLVISLVVSPPSIRTAPPTTPKTAPKATTPTTSAAGNTRERFNNVRHCYKCSGLGHYARDCPNPKILAFVTDDADLIYDTDAEPEVDKPGDELVYPDHGKVLVIQRVLNVAISKSVDDTSWLRNYIFRTKCTSKGKICDMIIDGGSCENVVSTYMVEKLGMKTEDHPEPYQLTWLKKGNTVKVSKRCLVQFSIGKNYKDEVWCEVIPMDAAHILLGRLWHFDRKTKHDGFQNTYSFKKDGVNITLVPFDSRQTQTEGSNFFMKKTDIKGLVKTSPYVFTLVVVEENEIISEALLPVHPLHKEFADVIPDDIPPRLPDIRDIQHYIDFIPGSAIPNRPAYRVNPSSLEQHLSHLRQIFSVLRAQKLYANGKKCHFFVIEVTFLGYIVTGSSIKIDPTKVEVIISWPTPSTIHDIRSFHRLASFYRRFIRNFSSIIAPLTECMKGGRFTWTSEAAKAFDILKAKVTEAPILALPNFDRAFQVKCDASRVGIGGVQSQNQRPIPFFSEKLNVVRRKYSTYDKEFYAIAFLFVIRHKVGSDNQVADALSRHHSLITTMQIRVQGFDLFRGLYCDDPDFREIWSKCDNAIILEGHAGGLAGHFGHDNTLALLREQFYWPKMERDVNRLIKRCRACRIAKTHSSNAGLSVPVAPWKDVSLDFVLEIVKLHGVPKTLTSDRDVKFVSHFWRTLWTRLGYKLQFNSSHLPQTDGQTEVVNQSLGNLLRSLIGDNAKQWDLILPQAEFSYNRSVNRTTGKSPFEVVFGQNPITPLDLIPVPEVGQFSKEGADQSEQIKELHRSVQEQIIRHNKQYKKHADKRQKQILYREGDLVWIHLCKERFPARRFGKLKPRGDGPFCVLKKINENAYKIEVPGHYNVSATFNVTDLSPYNGDSDDEPDSGSSLFQEGEDDADTVNERVNIENTPGTYFSATNFCGGLG